MISKKPILKSEYFSSIISPFLFILKRYMKVLNGIRLSCFVDIGKSVTVE